MSSDWSLCPLIGHYVCWLVIILSDYRYSIINKHWEILVSCSDKEMNCIQAHETAFKLMDLHAFCTHFWTFWWILVKMSWLINHNWTVGLKPGQGLLAARLLWEWMSESYNFHIHQKSCSLVNVVDTFAVAKRLLFMMTISSTKTLSYSSN